MRCGLGWLRIALPSNCLPCPVLDKDSLLLRLVLLEKSLFVSAEYLAAQTYVRRLNQPADFFVIVAIQMCLPLCTALF